MLAALAASVPFPKRLGAPHGYGELAEFLLANGYMNGEFIRIDGEIRMAAHWIVILARLLACDVVAALRQQRRTNI